MEHGNLYLTSLVAGGFAGLFVDVALFPLDTLKTRLQAAQGFAKAGGFRGVYKGLGAQAVGGVPQAALFFLTYETIKAHTIPAVPASLAPVIHMSAAAIAEVVACLVRVPAEIAKQRCQTCVKNNSTAVKILVNAYKKEGFINGLYRGFGSTVVRDVPFSFIQFPLLEFLKVKYSSKLKHDQPLNSWEVALCGSAASGFSAAVTTPFDVAKTRIMLAEGNLITDDSLKMGTVLKGVYRDQGMAGLFSGFVPRVCWMTIGGAVFFGVYNLGQTFCNKYLFFNSKNHVDS